MASAGADLAVLSELVPPPTRPLRAAESGNWDTLLAAVGFGFPEEFREYGQLYGTGEIEAGGYVLQVANPLDPAYPGWVLRQAEVMRTRGDQPPRRTTRFYPEDGGAVPFASDLSGELVFFQPRGRAIRVATCPTGDPNDLVEYRHGFIGFLVAVFAGRLEPEYFPNRALRRSTPTFKKRAWLR
jgi:hypothetical protein